MTESSTPSAAAFDLNADTVPDTVVVDTNADGVADVEAFDLDADSVPDVAVVDTNADGVADAVFDISEDVPAAPEDSPETTATPADETDLAGDSFTPPDEVTDADLEQAQADLDYSESMSEYSETSLDAASMDLS
ncbi:MAG TPA: hypothetical protein VE442_02350 [Jatrophihabitans sp.]|jgi:hypothetical protein|nr:hypothetical protein [Jatrophihabitans sp.]